MRFLTQASTLTRPTFPKSIHRPNILARLNTLVALVILRQQDGGR